MAVTTEICFLHRIGSGPRRLGFKSDCFISDEARTNPPKNCPTKTFNKFAYERDDIDVPRPRVIAAREQKAETDSHYRFDVAPVCSHSRAANKPCGCTSIAPNSD